MRIIGGHDYYDSALAYGRDDDIIYVRNNLEIEHDKTPLFWSDRQIFRYNRRNSFHNSHIVDGESRYDRCVNLYLCGVRYFGVEIYSHSGFKEVIWSYEKLQEYAEKNGLKIYVNKFNWFHESSVKELFEAKTSKEELDWLITNQIAIAVGYPEVGAKNIWHCNDAKKYPLRSLQFQKVMDPYTLFQELSMFVGNLPKDGPPMVQITDPKIKISKHGFDQWSFRKHKDDPR